jgi:hypothetical protein
MLRNADRIIGIGDRITSEHLIESPEPRSNAFGIVIESRRNRDRISPENASDQLWRGSGERNRGSMYKNRIGGAAEWGERAMVRKAPMVKRKWRKSGDCAMKDGVLAWGELAL